MSRYVVDASVVIKWFLAEPQTEAAHRLLAGNHDLLVPDLVYAEVGNILWKRLRRGELHQEPALAIMQAVVNLALETHASSPLAVSALEIAHQTQRTAYDSLYLALAVRETSALVTADAKFYHALHGGPLSQHLIWIEDI